MKSKRNNGTTGVKRRTSSRLAKSTSSLPELEDRYIHENLTVGEFRRAIKNNPNDICNDFEIKYAVEVLQFVSLHHSIERSRIARKILSDVGLSAFIPNNATKRRSENSIWRWLKEDYINLFIQIDKISSCVRRTWHLYDDVKESVRRIINEIYGFVPSSQLVQKITRGERGSSYTNLALSIFSEVSGVVAYYNLHKFYYNKNTVQRRVEFDTPKPGIEISRLTIRKPPQTTIALEQLVRDNRHVIQVYNESFRYFQFGHSIALFPFLCDYTTRMNYLKDPVQVSELEQPLLKK